jgi:hypothetical protein
MTLHNSSGPFSRKAPRHQGRQSTNPALFSLPERQEIDNLIDPKITTEDLAVGNLRHLYSSPESQFRNTSYEIGWQAQRDLADHANQHFINGTFGTGEEGRLKTIEHQTLMYNGMLAGMSFGESHRYALAKGPQPVK